ncbi:MAG: hypothetical protein Q9M27_04420 [Mariprofundaceae bacterium]|nr:hypothetical protein [Mariprofundaceae bacterium]
MRKIKEVLRLKWLCGVSERRIAKTCHISRSTVLEYVGRAKAAGLGWPMPEGMDDARLDALLFPPASKLAAVHRSLPDWSQVHQDMKGKNVTLCLLWQEYKAQHPDDGFQYSRFSELYQGH